MVRTTCPRCLGSREISERVGRDLISSICPRCNGTGMIGEDRPGQPRPQPPQDPPRTEETPTGVTIGVIAAIGLWIFLATTYAFDEWWHPAAAGAIAGLIAGFFWRLVIGIAIVVVIGVIGYAFLQS